MKLFEVRIIVDDGDGGEVHDTEEASSPWAAISKVWRAHRNELDGVAWTATAEEVY